MKDCLKVLLVASEAAPFIKSGGLGDVAGSLPKALRAQGVDVRVVIPRYMTVKEKKCMEWNIWANSLFICCGGHSRQNFGEAR